jgi:enoyl-CoA hydratase
MTIHYELRDHIVTITIDRPEKKNALDPDHTQALIRAWKTFRDDPDAWVAIITGVKDSFYVGGDLSVLSNVAAEVRETGNWTADELFTDGQGGRASLKGLNVYKPIIAAVNGYCMAGGVELLGGTDLRVASSTAVFQISEPRRGLIAFGGTTARLPRQLTWPAAMELLLLAGRISAQRALELGLINAVVEPDGLMDAAYAYAREITKNAPLAVQATKKSAMLGFQAGSLQEAYEIENAAGLEVFSTEDATEGSRAFLEKREPMWKGR